ncbi:MAG TPA: carboxypeptidase regulatory-like domain-containing protein [Thermoanaerobaculia bacterium]|nr:carboxypeptidase regulatory-like domain-containing protein [Thermoanaerobaculia bacterium]
MSALRRLLYLTAVVLLAIAPLTNAQTTTGNIAGSVTAGEDLLPGVTVEAVHTPTGTRYQAVSGSNGRFLLPNVRVGGPYTVTANLEGFRPSETRNLTVTLGTTTEVDVRLALATVTEAITVTATADDIINPNRTGSTSAVTEEQLETLPTVNRQLQDFARTNPYVTTSLTGDGTFMMIAGRNNRYNNIQIDGAVNNDLFGLSSSGTPGGGSGTQPVSLDAIEQLQVLVSPYDVRQSGFTGGGLNAVTRSGTNAFEGSFFGTQRNLDYIGESDVLSELPEFEQTQYGGRLGGRIIRDKLFFFVSGEENDREQPDGTRACTDAADCAAAASNNTPGVYRGNPAAYEVANFLRDRYGYESGDLGDIIFNTKSTLLFGRLDANIGNSNNFTLRHNYVDANNVNTPSSFTRTTTRFYFPNNLYLFPSETNSTVGQLNSVFSANAFNEARVNFTTVREHRETPGDIFPTIEIGASQRNGALQTGIERFSGANALDQDILEITDDFTWVYGNHNFVFGTSNQIFEFSNLFISDFYGYYLFPDLAALQAGTPSQYSIGFATGDDPRRATAFEAAQYSLYVSDQWRVSNNVTLTLGLRADRPQFNTTPSHNPAVQTALGFDTSDVPAERITWEPRVGFNWDIGGSGKQQLRGGVGVFQGRAPFVWISNAYGGTGIEQVLLTCANNCTRPTFNPDPENQPRNLGSAAAQDIALADPDFQFPRVLRATLGYDRELFWGIRGSAELLWSQTQQDVFYHNVAKQESGVSALDGRKTYSNRVAGFGNAYFLTNTDEGEEFTQTVTFDKRIGNLVLNANYAHQEAKSVGDFTSSTASSQWQFGYISRTGDLFNPELTTSVFEIEHRFNISATYAFNTGAFGHNFGLFYVAQAGQPYSLLMGGDINRDGSGNNDLLYIPNDLILCPATSNGTPNATSPCRTSQGVTQAPIDKNYFNNFLTSVGLEPGSGEAPARNSLRAPWTRRLDFHYEIGLPQFLGTRVSLQADILNVLNMFDQESGVQRFVLNNTFNPVTYVGQDPTSGLPVYRETTAGRQDASRPNEFVLGSLNPGAQYSTGNLASRWQGRLGIRVSF